MVELGDGQTGMHTTFRIVRLLCCVTVNTVGVIFLRRLYLFSPTYATNLATDHASGNNAYHKVGLLYNCYSISTDTCSDVVNDI
jgi:hypothetical protein